MHLAVLLFLAAAVTARPQDGALERRFPVPDLGEAAVAEQPSPPLQFQPGPFIVPNSAPTFSEESGPVSDIGFVFSSDVPSQQVVEIEPVVLEQTNSPRQGAGLIGQSFHLSSDRDAHVIRQDRLEPTGDGVSGVSYETSNGINVVSRTSLDEDGFNVIEGSYSYTSPDGVPVQVRYIADRDGFRYTGLGLPVGPAIPPHAQEQIERGKRLHAEAARLRAEQQRL